MIYYLLITCVASGIFPDPQCNIDGVYLDSKQCTNMISELSGQSDGRFFMASCEQIGQAKEASK